MTAPTTPDAGALAARLGGNVRQYGAGPLVLYLHARDTPDLPAALVLLAADWNVLAVPHDGISGGQQALVAALGDAEYGIVAEHAAASLALRLAAQATPPLRALVLLAPPEVATVLADAGVAAAATTVAEQRTPLLVLDGTALPAAHKAANHRYRETWPHAHFVYVYAAGDDPAQQRPGPVLALLDDFLRYQQGFLVNRQSSAIHP